MKIFRSFLASAKNSLKGILKNLPAGLLSMASIATIMLVLGLILLTALNLNGIVTKINESLGEVVVYVFDDLDKGETEDFLNYLSNQEEIAQLTYTSKIQAMEDARIKFKDSLDISKLRTNPFPPSISIKLDDLEYADELVEKLSSDDRVFKIRYYKEPIEKFISADRVIKFGGLMAFVVILIASILIISNIIRMAIAARGSEIEIMKYVGASESFIKGPFIFEGIFFSVLGCLISYFSIIKLYRKFFDIFNQSIYRYISYDLIMIEDIKMDVLIIFLAIGLGVGLIGSLQSVRKYIRV